MHHYIIRQQQLNCDLKTAWDFFSAPGNLASITPEEMKFVVRTPMEKKIFEGMEINYFVSPLLGIPLKWKTKITQVDPLKSFTDFQEKGPYRYWKHHHEFIPGKKGVLLKDTVEYALPLGILGWLAHVVFVRKKLTYIFDYRREKLEQLFNQSSSR